MEGVSDGLRWDESGGSTIIRRGFIGSGAFEFLRDCMNVEYILESEHSSLHHLLSSVFYMLSFCDILP